MAEPEVETDATVTTETGTEPSGLKFTDESARDAVFDAAFAELDDGQDAAPAEGNEDPGDAQPDEPAHEEPAPAKAAAAPAPKAGEPDEAMERALLALRYSGVPSEIIKTTPRDQLIAWGTEAAARRAKTEAALEERATELRELKERTTKAPDAQASPAAAPDWSPHLKALAETLGLEPEAAKAAFGPVLDAVYKQATGALEGRVSQTEATAAQVAREQGQRTISEQMRRLEATYPNAGLAKDPDLRSKVQEKALALYKTGEYGDADSIFNDAAAILRLSERGVPAEKRRNGVSSSQTERPRAGDLSEDDGFLAAMDRVEAGDLRGAYDIGSRIKPPPPRTTKRR